jgi:hypothetical protein
MRIFLPAFLFFVVVLSACSGGGESSSPTDSYQLSIAMERMDQVDLDPIQVTMTLTNNAASVSGATLTLNVPKGAVSSVSDNGDGTYQFTITPANTGVYPVTVSYNTQSISRQAVVFDNVSSGVGQPMSVPGDFVNTAGYEDGVTITPDGEYLFVQYGPVYFSGIIYIQTICQDENLNYSLFDIINCHDNANSDWVFNAIGPYGGAVRPGFPVARINNGVISHLETIVVPGVANGLFVPPTVFYGFKRQADGSFAEPFLVAFDDQERAVQSPYGLSFQMISDSMANFTVSWDDFNNQLGDDGADVYAGLMTLGQNNSLGDVTYSGEYIDQTSPTITPMNFDVTSGVQGNSHLYVDNANIVQSIWVDDEKTTHDLTVYTRASGTFPSSTWTAVTLPAVINTAEEESQPFFTGSRLYLRRGDAIVYHDYKGSGFTDFDLAGSWGSEVLVLQSNISTTTGETVAVGEPTIANYNGRTYLYFVYGINRATGLNNLIDINMDAGFVELL